MDSNGALTFLQYRSCVITTHSQILEGPCAEILEALIECNNKNEYNFGKKCLDVRTALQKCAVKNKFGELGKDYTM
jgi:hypothetical protein